MKLSVAVAIFLLTGAALADPDTAPPTLPPSPPFPESVTPPQILQSHACNGTYYPTHPVKLTSGETDLSYTIAEDGTVRDVVIDQSSGEDFRDEMAAKCVATWRYKPATQDGKPIAVHWKTRFEWRGPHSQ